MNQNDNLRDLKQAEERENQAEEEILKNWRERNEYYKKQQLEIEQRKEDLINDYISWVDVAFTNVIDHIDIRELAITNFKFQLNKLLQYATENRCKIEGAMDSSS